MAGEGPTTATRLGVDRKGGARVGRRSPWRARRLPLPVQVGGAHRAHALPAGIPVDGVRRALRGATAIHCRDVDTAVDAAAPVRRRSDHLAAARGVRLATSPLRLSPAGVARRVRSRAGQRARGARALPLHHQTASTRHGDERAGCAHGLHAAQQTHPLDRAAPRRGARVRSHAQVAAEPHRLARIGSGDERSDMRLYPRCTHPYTHTHTGSPFHSFLCSASGRVVIRRPDVRIRRGRRRAAHKPTRPAQSRTRFPLRCCGARRLGDAQQRRAQTGTLVQLVLVVIIVNAAAFRRPRLLFLRGSRARPTAASQHPRRQRRRGCGRRRGP
eukprot:ctg_901.g204